MGRRNLLTKEERKQFFSVSVDEAQLVKHYTLSPDDLERSFAKRGARMHVKALDLIGENTAPFCRRRARKGEVRGRRH